MAALRRFYELVTGRYGVRYSGWGESLAQQVREGVRFPTVRDGAAFITLNLDRIEAGLRWPK
jgi:hypothetical protein